MIQVQVKLRLSPRQERQLTRWLRHLAAIWNWAIKRIEYDTGNGIYHSSTSTRLGCIRCRGAFTHQLALVAADFTRKHVHTVATPSNAQRARAIDNLLGFLKVTPLKLNEDDAATLSILIDAVTTDVEQGTCTWTCEPNPDIEMWETDCDNTFQFEADGPTENKMKFCCYRGKPLAGKVAERREEGEGDG